ncbi:flocculation protein FLO11 [Etheostoma spectabile]|nr:flocculation protein FLO11-like [Etheostoma spectabile]
MPVNGTKLKVAERPTLYRKPKGPLRFNTTRVVPGWRNVGQGSLRKSPVGQKKKEQILPEKPKPGVPTSEGRTTALHERDPSVDASSTKRRPDENPALSATSGTDSDTNRQRSSEEPSVGVHSKKQPDVGTAGQENNTAPVSPGPTGTVQSQEKKCMNKVKVTHIRLPHPGRGSGCKGDGTELVRKTAGSDQGSSEANDLKPLSAETDLDYTPGPLHKLLKDTFDGLNIKTFSVHLSEPSNLSLDAETVRKQIISGLRPLPPSFSWSSSSSSSSTLQSPSRSSATPASSSVPSSPSSLALPSLAPSSSSSLTLSMASPSSLPSPPSSSSSLSSSDKSGSVGSNEPDVENSQIATDVKSPEDIKLTEKGGVHLFQRTPLKHGYVRRPRPNVGLFQNRTRLNLRLPHHSTPRLNLIPRRETETSPASANELSSSPSSSNLEDSSSVDVNASLRNTSGDEDVATKPSSSGVKQNQEKMPTERGRVPVRRLPGYVRRQNFGPLQNKTRPNLRQLPPPFRPLNPLSGTRREHVSSTESPATLFSVAKESHSAEGTTPKEGDTEDRVGTTMSTEFNQTLRRSEAFSTHRPTTKVIGSKGTYFRRSQLSDGRSQNNTRTNLRPPQHPHRGPVRKPFPARKQTGGITVGSQISHLEKDSAIEIPDDQSGGQDAPMPTQGVQIRQSGGEDTAVRPQTNKLVEGDSAPIQTTRSGEEETSTLDSNSDSDTHKDGVNTGKNPGATIRGRPTLKQTSDSRHGDPRSVKPPKRQPPTPTRRMTAQSPTQIRHHNGGSKRTEDKTSNIAKRLFESKTESIDSELQTGSDVPSSVVTREPLDYVGVTNRTSDGFTLVWDSPENKYKNFVVTSKDIGKEEGPTQDSKKDHEDQEDSRKEAKDQEEEHEDSRKEAKDQEEEQEDLRKDGGIEEVEVTKQPTKETHSENGSSEHENQVPESVSMPVPRIQSGTTAKSVAGSDNTFKKVLSGSARSFQFENLPPQTEYTVTLLGKGPGLLSRLHKLVISTG